VAKTGVPVISANSCLGNIYCSHMMGLVVRVSVGLGLSAALANSWRLRGLAFLTIKAHNRHAAPSRMLHLRQLSLQPCTTAPASCLLTCIALKSPPAATAVVR
jgi:hypothetical protein